MECAFTEKLRLDFMRIEARQWGMDDDTKDLIAKLSTRIGMVMEDASLVALTGARGSAAEVASTVARIELASAQIAVLVQATKVLLTQGLDGHLSGSLEK
jgi:hypothetical protein